jgi:polyhydroxyalkanoate synthesis regulator phasin
MTSMTRRKIVVLAGASAVALLGVGLGAAGAVAAQRILSPNDETKAIIDDAAKQLGVKPEALSNALRKALENRIDDAVAAGRLTKEQGETLKERLESGDYPLFFGPRGPRAHVFGGGFGLGHVWRFELLDAAASYLGLGEADLREALQDKTLAEIAKDQGKSASGLVQALVNAQEKRIDEAVADGRITKDQASALEANLEDRMQALVKGELRDGGLGRHPGLWRGPASPRGPPALFGPPA